jgi:hypothetical protein
LNWPIEKKPDKNFDYERSIHQLAAPASATRAVGPSMVDRTGNNSIALTGWTAAATPG